MVKKQKKPKKNSVAKLCCHRNCGHTTVCNKMFPVKF